MESFEEFKKEALKDPGDYGKIIYFDRGRAFPVGTVGSDIMLLVFNDPFNFIDDKMFCRIYNFRKPF